MTLRKAFVAAGAAVVLAAGFGTGALLVGSGSSSSAAAAASCQVIGYQSGVAAAMNRLRRLDPGGTNAAHTGAYDKLERTLAILAYDHDAACVSSPPPGTTTSSPPPTTTAPPPVTTGPTVIVAPQTYNKSGRGDARYCVAGLPRNGNGRLYDAYATYDDDGLQLGGRSETDVPGLRYSDNMNDLGPCDGYTEAGKTFPPWPPESYRR